VGKLTAFFFDIFLDMETGKVDFIICEKGGFWYLESYQVPKDIAIQPNQILVDWAKVEKLSDEPDIVYVGVYWRDQLLDDTGITNEAAVNKAYSTMLYGECNERN